MYRRDDYEKQDKRNRGEGVSKAKPRAEKHLLTAHLSVMLCRFYKYGVFYIALASHYCYLCQWLATVTIRHSSRKRQKALCREQQPSSNLGQTRGVATVGKQEAFKHLS